MRKYSEIPDDPPILISPVIMDDLDVARWILYLESHRAELTAYSIPEFLAMSREVKRLREDRAAMIRAMRTAGEWLKAWE